MSEQPVQVVGGKKPRRHAGPISATVTAGLALALLLLTLGTNLYIVPRFKEIFNDFGTTLPGPTMLVLHISHFCVSYWFLVVPLIILLFAGLIVWIWLADWRSGLVASIVLIIVLLIYLVSLIVRLFLPLFDLIKFSRGGGGL